MLWGDGFEIETLINVRVAMAGVRIQEVPSVEQLRLHGTSNLNAVSDGWRVLRTALRERKDRRERAHALRRMTRVEHRTERPTVIDLTQPAAVDAQGGHWGGPGA
jgi:hypothetical protein